MRIQARPTPPQMAPASDRPPCGTAGLAFAGFCSRCGRERLPAARFCIACGFQFTGPGPPLEVAQELTPVNAYPIRYRVRDDPRRQRALTVFRLVIAVPHLIGWVLVLPLSLVLAVLSWPFMLVTGRLPAPCHRLQAA